MSEPVIPAPTPTNEAVELATLRRVNAELLKAKHDLKARVATLEGEAATLESKAEKATALIRASVIDVPMKKFAEELSNAPDLFLAELHKDYDVVAAHTGEISLLAKDGKEVKGRDGKPLAWTRHGFYALLAGLPGDTKTDRMKTFGVLMRPAMASGGAGRISPSYPVQSSPESDKQDIAPSFGLR
jgi:hypothetical protein